MPRRPVRRDRFVCRALGIALSAACLGEFACGAPRLKQPRTPAAVPPPVARALVPPLSAKARAALDAKLVNAAGAGDVNRVKALLAKGASAGARAGDGTPALVAAISGPMYDTGGGVREVVRALVAAGADANACAPDGSTALIALCRASMDERLDVARTLLAHGARPNNRDRKGRTALMAAAQTDAADLCRLLLASGADPNIRDLSGKTALDIARSSAERAAVPVLSRHGAPHRGAKAH